MNRLVLGVAALVAGLSGCASPARYIERTGDTGVVAIPSNTDAWPSYNRHEAMELIRKHVGPNYDIIEEREVATGKTTLNNQQVNNEQTWNSSNPFLPANRQTVNNTTTTHDVTEWRIAYRKRMIPGPQMPTGGSALPIGMSPGVGTAPAGGVPPGGTAVQQPQYPHPATGTTPGTSMQPAGGAMPLAPGAGVVPAVGPVAPVGPGPGAAPGVYGSVGAVYGTMR
jgi:hypothetical protein